MSQKILLSSLFEHNPVCRDSIKKLQTITDHGRPQGGVEIVEHSLIVERAIVWKMGGFEHFFYLLHNKKCVFRDDEMESAFSYRNY